MSSFINRIKRKLEEAAATSTMPRVFFEPREEKVLHGLLEICEMSRKDESILGWTIAKDHHGWHIGFLSVEKNVITSNHTNLEEAVKDVCKNMIEHAMKGAPEA